MEPSSPCYAVSPLSHSLPLSLNAQEHPHQHSPCTTPPLNNSSSERDRREERDRQTELPAKKQKSDQTEKRIPSSFASLPNRGEEEGDPVHPEREEEMGMMPGWVAGLVAETFFVGCPAHESRKKNEKNIFCLGCCASICTHCAPAHRHHPRLQVRRYVYNDVVRLGDMENLIDCSYVQSYTINSAKVIFLKPRPQSRPFKGSGNVCLKCNRMLQEPFRFCCLSCKVDHVMMQGGDLSNILQYYGAAADDPDHLAFPRFENLRVDGSDLDEDTDGGTVTPNSILEDPTPRYGGGCGSSDNGGSVARRGEAAAAAKRKKGGGFFPQIVLSLGNRRKGAPHRSPLA